MLRTGGNINIPATIAILELSIYCFSSEFQFVVLRLTRQLGKLPDAMPHHMSITTGQSSRVTTDSTILSFA